MASLLTVRIDKGNSPTLGFRLQGGKDFGTPLVIQKVNGGSPAERAGLVAGDSVVKINNVDVYNLRHKDAQDVVVRAGPSFELTIQRGGSTWKPSVTPTGPVYSPGSNINNVNPVTRTSLAAKHTDNFGSVGTGHNLSAKPFAPQVNGAVNGGPKVVNKQYNSPLKLYSEESIAETLSAQTEVLSTGALGVNFKKNERNYDASNSEVLRALKEAENDPNYQDQVIRSDFYSTQSHAIGGRKSTTPKPNPIEQTRTIAVDTSEQGVTPKPPPEGATICSDCERVIVGVFVRIKEKNLHVECFKCSTCGSSLKNVGYYNINNKLYCDIHAKSAALKNQPNSNLVPITVPPGGKAPAHAISSALSSHSYPTPSPLSPKINSAGTTYPASNFSGPKPFSHIGAPLSPQNTLPRTGPLSPVAPAQAPPFNHSYTPSAYSPSSEHENELCHAKESENIVELDEISLQIPNQPPPPPPVPVYSQINVSIPCQRTSPQLDSIGSSPRSDYSSYSSSSGKTTQLSETIRETREKILKEIKNLTPKLKSVHLSDTQSPKLSHVISNTEKNLKIRNEPSENIIPIYYADSHQKLDLPDHLTFAQDDGFKPDHNRFNVSTKILSDRIHSDYRDSSDDRTIQKVADGNGITRITIRNSVTTDAADYKPSTTGTAPVCWKCNTEIVRGPFITALGKIWCPSHFICATQSCRRPLQDVGFVEEHGQLYCEYCFEQYLAPACSKCGGKIKGDCLKAIGKNFHPECFSCSYCGKLFGNSSFFLEDGSPYCEADWNELFTTKCFACAFPIEAGDRWVEALNNNYHSQCFNCTMCKKNLEGQSFFAKGGRPFCKNHAR